MENEEKAYSYWLHQIPGIGNKKAEELIQTAGSAKAVYFASEKQLRQVLRQKEWDNFRESIVSYKIKEEYEKLQRSGIKLVSKFEQGYPVRLKRIRDAPFLLYYLGELPEEAIPSLAIIGARECSSYGSLMASAFAGCAAEKGISVISGMARGIDGISQETALKAGGRTYAVLGCGVDICYPSSNRSLYEEIVKTGGVLSPYPPGTKPARTLFPYRNKIVAGLSDSVLVVEARQKSGTLITVDMALEQGKDVYAVPGRLTDRLSDGCNYLIRQGAGIVLSPEDLISEMIILENRQSRKREGLEKGNEKEVREREYDEILRFLDLTPRTLEEILEEMKKEGKEMPLSRLMMELILLCMEGTAKQVAGNCFVKSCKERENILQ